MRDYEEYEEYEEYEDRYGPATRNGEGHWNGQVYPQVMLQLWKELETATVG